MKTKRVLSPIIFQVVLYSLQFVILPSVYYISPSDIVRTAVEIILSTLFITIVGMIFFRNEFRWRLLGWLVHLVLMTIYHSDNIFSMGNGMFDFNVITITFVSLLILGTQILVWLFMKFSNRMNKKMN